MRRPTVDLVEAHEVMESLSIFLQWERKRFRDERAYRLSRRLCTKQQLALRMERMLASIKLLPKQTLATFPLAQAESLLREAKP